MKEGIARIASAAAIALVLVATPAGATEAGPAISTEFNFSDLVGVNPIGNGPEIGSSDYYEGGLYDQLGANSVVPSSGTTVTATQGTFSTNVGFIGGPGAANPNEFSQLLPLNEVISGGLTGQWTLTAKNGSYPIAGVGTTPSLVDTSPPPPVVSVTLSGSQLAPTLNWTIPAGSTATAQTVYVWSLSPGSPIEAIYKGPAITASTTQFTIPSGVLQAGQVYAIAVQSDVDSNGLAGQLEARTRSFTAPFTPTTGNFSQPVVLPSVSSTPSAYGGPVYNFNTPVIANTPIAIDPPAAVGFIYDIGAGNPDFASVELPNIGSSNPYDIYTWNGSKFVFDQTLEPDTVLSFGNGVSEFEVLGIPVSVGLDPNSATDFVTTLTFEGSGAFTGTMTPIIAVPEPSTWAMMLIGFAGLGFAGYRGARGGTRRRCLNHPTQRASASNRLKAPREAGRGASYCLTTHRVEAV
jgi:hypothetical protein